MQIGFQVFGDEYSPYLIEFVKFFQYSFKIKISSWRSGGRGLAIFFFYIYNEATETTEATEATEACVSCTSGLTGLITCISSI